MKLDHTLIAKIFLDEAESAGFCGTGFLVTADHVLTCAHVLFGAREWPLQEQTRDCDSMPEVRLYFGNNPDPAFERRGTLAAYDLPDLALIRLNEPLPSPPVPLASALTSQHEAALSQIRGLVIGFSQTESAKLIERPVNGQIAVAWDFYTQQLLSIQITGGLSPGMSGSPLIFDSRNGQVCLGMAHLGGDGSPISRIILSPTLISFLVGQGINPSIVGADQCFRTGEGSDLTSAIARLKEAVRRLIDSDTGGADGALLQQSLLNGTLTFASDSSRVIVSGNNYRVVFRVDEESSTALGEKLFPTPIGVAPPPPSVFFVGRSRDMAAVKGLLCDSHSPDSEAVVVIQGWPGVGKSSFASALGREIELMARFPDGVLWTAVGQSPNLFSSLSAWARWLGIPDTLRMPTLKDAVERIQRAIESRRLLLIADDVWTTDDAVPFLGLRSKGCRLLITSRVPAMAAQITTIPVKPYTLPVLSEDDALQLLWNLAAEVVEKNQDMCRVLLKDIEHLPLAIHVAGRLLRIEAKLGLSVEELIEGIRSGAEIIKATAPEDRAEDGRIPTVSALLARSTDSLDERTRECFAYLGAFAPKPATFDLEAMAAVWEVRDPKPYVRTLVGQGLLEAAPNGRFQMHALLVAHACSMFSE